MDRKCWLGRLGVAGGWRSLRGSSMLRRIIRRPVASATSTLIRRACNSAAWECTPPAAHPYDWLRCARFRAPRSGQSFVDTFVVCRSAHSADMPAGTRRPGGVGSSRRVDPSGFQTPELAEEGGDVGHLEVQPMERRCFKAGTLIDRRESTCRRALDQRARPRARRLALTHYVAARNSGFNGCDGPDKKATVGTGTRHLPRVGRPYRGLAGGAQPRQRRAYAVCSRKKEHQRSGKSRFSAVGPSGG